jgi:ribosomal protein S18 acetylase RimI-like enzyme
LKVFREQSLSEARNNSKNPEPLPGLFKVTRAQAGPVMEVLSRAFMTYPMMLHYYPDELKRLTILRSMMAVPVYTCLAKGAIYAPTEKLEGIAIWSDGDDYPVGGWRLLRTVPLPYLWGFMRNGGSRMQNMDRFITQIHKKLVPQRHYYLEVLGVDPLHQKKGYSSLLIKPMLEQLEKQNLDCFLETQDPADVAIYRHFGFETIDESPVPGTPLTSWAMLKKA